ncbi:hypothetical protein PsalN5692_00882 [Piscirickettsia salmonis]|nr:hypothetical protein PsalN5692_00882 [Piscirickettsia salmonis]
MDMNSLLGVALHMTEGVLISVKFMKLIQLNQNIKYIKTRLLI